MPTNNQLHILHWNAQGISNVSKIRELQLLLQSKEIDIVLLNETFLNSNSRFYLQNYVIVRNDRPSHGGGVAIGIHKTISFLQLPVYNTPTIENISVEVVINNRSIVVTSAYCPKYNQSFLQDIKKITPQNKEFLTFGDFNAKHTNWNCQRANTAGTQLSIKHNIKHFNSFIIRRTAIIRPQPSFL